MVDVVGSSLGASWRTTGCTSTVVVETKSIGERVGNAAEGTGWVAAGFLEAMVALRTDGVAGVVAAAPVAAAVAVAAGDSAAVAAVAAVAVAVAAVAVAVAESAVAAVVDVAAVAAVAAVAESALAAWAGSPAERIRSAGIAVVVLETPKEGWASPGLKNGPREGPDRLVASVRSHRRDLASRGRTLTMETRHRMGDGRACKGRWVRELPEVLAAAIVPGVETGMTANRILPTMQGPEQQSGEVRGGSVFRDLWKLVATSLSAPTAVGCPVEGRKTLLLPEGSRDCRLYPEKLPEGPSGAQAVRSVVAAVRAQWQLAKALGSWPACHMGLAMM